MGCLDSKHKIKSKSNNKKISQDKNTPQKEKKQQDLVLLKEPTIKIVKTTQNIDQFPLFYLIIQRIDESPLFPIYKITRKDNIDYYYELVLIKKKQIYLKTVSEFKECLDKIIDIDHPNILKIYEYFEDDESLYIIREFLDLNWQPIFLQFSNFSFLNEGDLTIIMKQLFSALFCLEEQEIFNGFIHYSNIYLTKNSFSIKIKDYGILQIRDQFTEIPYFLESPDFLAPERLDISNTNCIKGDLWSLGVFLYYLLTSSSPFNGESIEKIFTKIKLGCISKENLIRCSIEAKYLIEKLLKYDKNSRISAEKAWNDLWVIKNTSASKSSPQRYLNHLPQFESFVELYHLKKYWVDFLVKSRKVYEISDPKNTSDATQYDVREIVRSFIKAESIIEFEVNRLKNESTDKLKIIEKLAYSGNLNLNGKEDISLILVLKSLEVCDIFNPNKKIEILSRIQNSINQIKSQSIDVIGLKEILANSLRE